MKVTEFRIYCWVTKLIKRMLQTYLAIEQLKMEFKNGKNLNYKDISVRHKNGNMASFVDVEENRGWNLILIGRSGRSRVEV